MIFRFVKKDEPCKTCEVQAFNHERSIEILKENHKAAMDSMREQHAQQIESLREQLAAERTEKNLLLHTMLEERKPKEVPVPVISDEPVVIKNKTWATKRAELEAQSRQEAINLANMRRQEEIARLERETGIAENKPDHSVRMTSAAE